MEDELGDGWMHGVHPEDLPLYLQTSLTAMDARSRFTTEYRLRRYDGEYRWVLDTGVPRYDAAGHLAGYVGSSIDITGRHRVEQRLHEVGGRLLTVQEEERRRVARELQDELSQQLALLASELEQLSVDYPELRGDVSQRLVALSKRATTISGDAYRLSHQLHPSKLEALGLVASLRSYCREVSEQQKIHVSFTHGTSRRAFRWISHCASIGSSRKRSATSPGTAAPTRPTCSFSQGGAGSASGSPTAAPASIQASMETPGLA